MNPAKTPYSTFFLIFQCPILHILMFFNALFYKCISLCNNILQSGAVRGAGRKSLPPLDASTSSATAGSGAAGFVASTGSGAAGFVASTGSGAAGFVASTGSGAAGFVASTGSGAAGFVASTGSGAAGFVASTGSGTAVAELVEAPCRGNYSSTASAGAAESFTQRTETPKR